MHNHSLIAFWEGTTDAFGKREVEILAYLAEARGRTASDRECMIALGKTDPNSVRPRITELVKKGVLEECGAQEDPVTHKTVRVVRIRPDPRQPQRQFSFS